MTWARCEQELVRAREEWVEAYHEAVADGVPPHVRRQHIRQLLLDLLDVEEQTVRQDPILGALGALEKPWGYAMCEVHRAPVLQGELVAELVNGMVRISGEGPAHFFVAPDDLEALREAKGWPMLKVPAAGGEP